MRCSVGKGGNIRVRNNLRKDELFKILHKLIATKGRSGASRLWFWCEVYFFK